jgi:hypothetical protein
MLKGGGNYDKGHLVSGSSTSEDLRVFCTPKKKTQGDNEGAGKKM